MISRYKPVGWRNESYRHYLAAKGVKTANGYRIKSVSSKVLKDYAGMNPYAAKQLGFRSIRPDEILVAKDLSSEKRRRTVNHELIEAGNMERGMPYWDAHKVALREESGHRYFEQKSGYVESLFGKRAALASFGRKGDVAETKGSTTFVFPQEKKIIVNQKDMFLVGHFSDLFSKGDELEVKNVSGEVVRKITKSGSMVMIDPMNGENPIVVPLSEDVIYEPWFMDNGSFLFHAPEGISYIGKGALIKLFTEGDKFEAKQ